MKARVIGRHIKQKVYFLVTPGMIIRDGVNFQGSRDTATGSWGDWSAFVKQGKLVMALAEPEQLLG